MKAWWERTTYVFTNLSCQYWSQVAKKVLHKKNGSIIRIKNGLHCLIMWRKYNSVRNEARKFQSFLTDMQFRENRFPVQALFLSGTQDMKQFKAFQ